MLSHLCYAQLIDIMRASTSWTVLVIPYKARRRDPARSIIDSIWYTQPQKPATCPICLVPTHKHGQCTKICRSACSVYTPTPLPYLLLDLDLGECIGSSGTELWYIEEFPVVVLRLSAMNSPCLWLPTLTYFLVRLHRKPYFPCSSSVM